MIESLKELKNLTKNYFSHGDTTKVIEDTVNKLNIDNVYVNNDYTPFSRTNNNIKKLCNRLKCNFNGIDDIMLTPIDGILKPNKEPYSTFTPYMTKAITLNVNKPSKTNVKTKVQNLDNNELKYQIPLK